MTDLIARIEAAKEPRRYEPDERELFCKHCGWSSICHLPTKDGLLCDTGAILRGKERQ